MNCNKCKYRSTWIGKFARGRRIEARPYCEYHIREIKDFNGCPNYKKKRGSQEIIFGSIKFYLGDPIHITYLVRGRPGYVEIFKNYDILNTCILNKDTGELIQYDNIHRIRKLRGDKRTPKMP